MAVKYTFFWSGPFSQWYPSKFHYNGKDYNCAEQFMMAQKASVFGDYDTLLKIMDTDQPKTQKALGRKVANFDPDLWTKIAKLVVSKGTMLKYTQNPDLAKMLLATGDTLLVEASPYDKVWGVGLAEDDPRILDQAQWQGTNWLGEILTHVRDTVISEYFA